MISFVADVITSEPVCGEDIAILKAPENGWTHNDIVEAGKSLPHTTSALDAYLDQTWVGGSAF